MANYQEARVKTTNTQLRELKSAAKNKTGTTLIITKKNLQDEGLSHKLFLTARQKTKIRNSFPNNMSTYTKFSEAQISKIIQSGGFPGSWLAKLGKKVVTDLVIASAKNNFPGLVSNIASNPASNAIINLKKE